jgi:hypothetical protein
MEALLVLLVIIGLIATHVLANRLGIFGERRYRMGEKAATAFSSLEVMAQRNQKAPPKRWS